MKTITIRQVVTFRSSPLGVYRALADSRRHSGIIGMKAVISRKVGGTFSAFDGGITGVNLVLEPGWRIVQSWRAYDWPEGHLSRVSFTLTRIGGKTRLTLTHRDVPREHASSIARGWREYYWEPLRAVLEK